MPLKHQSKADLAKKQKIIEDKTFSLKNKNKSKNVWKYVESLHQFVQSKPDPKSMPRLKKEDEEKAKEELNDLLKIAASQPKVLVVLKELFASLGFHFDVFLFVPVLIPNIYYVSFIKPGSVQRALSASSHDLNIQRKREKIEL
ncbi:hypothetical protein Ccrd_018326 [Cynara cardunculus var. scolymus]|uniref:Uncharacterized protein n=1 Tax=Cynara cardunculus var. scolymus TaxID=59895 RepID=A0A103Y6E6_CYNCS|nr:hypothetical protein Ccrd_018326 [Cynara cardunculus var. scolymus]